MSKRQRYGIGDTSFKAAKGEAGIRQLVESFYRHMGTDPRFSTIYNMHQEDIPKSIDKLALFLCGWLGGPKRFQEKYGSISIPAAHQHLSIGIAERELWLTCMKESIDGQAYEESFKAYLIKQLRFPAEAIRRTCNQ